MNIVFNSLLLIVGVCLIIMVFFKDRTPAALPDPQGMHVATLAAG